MGSVGEEALGRILHHREGGQGFGDMVGTAWKVLAVMLSRAKFAAWSRNKLHAAVCVLFAKARFANEHNSLFFGFFFFFKLHTYIQHFVNSGQRGGKKGRNPIKFLFNIEAVTMGRLPQHGLFRQKGPWVSKSLHFIPKVPNAVCPRGEAHPSTALPAPGEPRAAPQTPPTPLTAGLAQPPRWSSNPAARWIYDP